MQNTEEYLSVHETALWLGVTDATVRRWIKGGPLGALRTPGHQWRISRAAIEQLLTKGDPNGSARD